MSAERARVLRSVSASSRAGLTLRRALADGAVPELAGVARRLRLGLPMCEALEGARPFLGGDTDALRLVVDLHERAGGNAAVMLDSVATAIDARLDATARAEASSAGARLSARMVAWLPLVALLLVPGGRAPVLDPMGLALLGAGLALCWAGMRWMDRLLPGPSESVDGTRLLAIVIASALSSGCTLDQVLDAAARRGDDDIGRAGRSHRLGLSWPQALQASTDKGLRSMGAAIDAPQRMGSPVATALQAFAARRAEELERDLERDIRRAPVKMVVPLTLCVLPSFGLIALTPFLRSLTPG